jgi:prepilin-type N-terminal cleavage/methylation domain-containing protein
MNAHPSRKGFSLVELIVVLLCIAIGLSLLLPAVYSAQVAAANRETVNKLKQLCLALHNCNDVNRKLPPAFDKFAGMPTPVAMHVYLLPYVEQLALYNAFMKDQAKGDDVKVPVFVAQDDPSKHTGAGVVNFAANLRVFSDKGMATKYNENMKALGAVEPGKASIPRTFQDGTSNIVVLATKYGACGMGGSKYTAAPNTAFAPFFGQNAAKVKAAAADKTAIYQLAPADKDCCTSPLMAQSFNKTALLVGIGDGSIRDVSTKVSAENWNRALQPNDGMVLGADW